MSKVLGIVSTPYHLLVFLFLKDAFLSEDEVDLAVTDKTPYMEELYKDGRFAPYFHKVFFADGRKIKNPYKSTATTLFESMVYNKTTKFILDKPLERYDSIYFASPAAPDEIVKEIAKSAILKNKNLNFFRFEDGFASYTRSPEHVISTPIGQKLYRLLFHYDIKEREKDLYLFEPAMAEKNVWLHKVQIPNNETRINKILSIAKDIFQFSVLPLDEQVLFLGQGTENGSLNPTTYQNLIRKVENFAGEDNFAIKPHPRGTYDDFKGELHVYNDPCPFELAIASGAMEDKVLISFYSTACVAGKLLFHSKCRIIFLYPLAEDSFNEKCNYEHYFSEFVKQCENVSIANSWEEFQKLLNNF